MKTNENINVAVIQATSIFFDKEACIQKIGDILKDCAANGAKMVLFPESFIPGYPRGFSFEATVGKRKHQGRELYREYWENSITAKGKDSETLAKLAKKFKVFLIVGVTERDEINGSLYCSLFYYSPDGELIGKHKKLKPTGIERLVWGEGAGDDLDIYQTEMGKIGGLVCWENYMPLARVALYSQGIHFYLAPTADDRQSWAASMKHIALEGRCFVLSCNQYFERSHYPERLLPYVYDSADILSRGGSVIISPMGKVLAGPAWDREEILFAELNPNELIESKMDFDAVGHYSRNDVFYFDWKRSEK